ncbi:hypothetical protein CC85DRAFT_288756 [Cutaneotrichosporon oleaginosum]|uniref:Phospholipase A2 domain-containing protein n=1 Tax=Cutaneotrichosporon oleaginosum TaxID=879819 RepID=A0A0J0XDW6_9TREE|nr:uncharacterized protein CC85DRAFT_288756 [Cutaneotrichosporon oleaginosum]KLT39267.1 hypothetical protein CC85DRAFT_288756 [Cutaneotrichosporon oleaginosum]
MTPYPDRTGRCPAGHVPVQNDVPIVPNGCGRPGGFPVDDWIVLDCCNGHDNCYSTCSKSKNTCDDEFHSCMKARCAEVHADSQMDENFCLVRAQTYATTVVILGQGGFDTGTEKHCNCQAQWDPIV